MWARRSPGSLRRIVKRGLVPQSFLSWLYREGKVQEYQLAMQAGFGKHSAKNLEALKFGLPPTDLSDAAWALTYWYRLNGDYQRALDQLLLRRMANPHVLNDGRHVVVEVDVLLKVGRVDAARAVVTDAINRLGETPELCFSAANVAAAGSKPRREKEQDVLGWLNKSFVRNGLAPIEPLDASLPLAINNIEARVSRPHSRCREAKISVLMPAYNAADTIAMAMASILNQTWENLELIVVDDGSSDGTWAVIERFAKRDPRVMLIKHHVNRGAYAARNTALSRATGDLVTVHDSDDWSHPEKLALQAIALSESRLVNLTKQIRVHDDLRVYVKPEGATLLNCYPSLMMTKFVLEELGAWDEARMSADGELWERLLIKNPNNKVVLNSGVPFSFHLFREGSLTATQLTGVETVYYGARCQYIGAYRYWHELESKKGAPDIAIQPGERRFPVPHICTPGPARQLNYDVLLVSDFSLPGGTTSSNVNMLRAAHRLGLRCACFHWPRIEFAKRPMSPKIRHLLHDGVADNVVAGESLRCELVIVNHPPLLNQLPDTLPKIDTEVCVIVVNQTPSTRTEGGRKLYDLPTAITNARAAFGVRPKLAPLSPSIRRFLQLTGQDASLTALDWTPLIDAKQYRRSGSSWSDSRPPVVGRHGRDSSDKWPADRDTLGQAYCADTDIEFRVLGGAERARQVLGGIPSNWVVFPFDSVDVREFLKGLDFFVHYPHEHWIEAFGRAPMEAMAAGVPVILPQLFRETFADAAVYAEPADVIGTIHRLWTDKDAYEAQIERGFDYVERTCDLACLEERVRPYLTRESSDGARKGKRSRSGETYWAGRTSLIYYNVVREVVRGLGGNSILDVGSAGCPYLDWFDASTKTSVDLRTPYISPTVQGITADFLQWEPDRSYDLVLCLQVLEHVREVKAFARKLLAVGRTAVVSVPYKWRKNAVKWHVHDPVDEIKLLAWFEREPNFACVVREANGHRRIVQVYEPSQNEWAAMPERQSILKTISELDQSSVSVRRGAELKRYDHK